MVATLDRETSMARMAVVLAAVLSLTGAGARAEESRPASPRGTASTQVGGHWEHPDDEEKREYVGGKWIDIDYGRPILRSRPDIFGQGDAYGKGVNAGAPVWRVGANATTRLKTEVALQLGDKKLAPGDYALFVDLHAGAWTLIVSTQKSTDHYNPKDKSKIWGSYCYDPKFEVVRVPMTVSTLPTSIDQLTIQFEDVSNQGGRLAVLWDKTRAVVPFALAP
jgi:hypothetical protein